MEGFQNKSELSYTLHFLPMNYIKEKIIPTTNTHGKTRTQVWADLDLDDFLNLMEIFLSMEVYEIDGPRRMYWNTEGTNFFPAMNYRKIMSRSRFEDLMRHMQLSFAKDDNKEILEFIEIVNLQFCESLTPSS